MVNDLMTTDELINHLKVQHGYRDTETDPDPQTSEQPWSFGIVNLSHFVWTRTGLDSLHEQDHQDYPNTGTPVRGWAHRHKKDG